MLFAPDEFKRKPVTECQFRSGQHQILFLHLHLIGCQKLGLYSVKYSIDKGLSLKHWIIWMDGLNSETLLFTEILIGILSINISQQHMNGFVLVDPHQVCLPDALLVWKTFQWSRSVNLTETFVILCNLYSTSSENVLSGYICWFDAQLTERILRTNLVHKQISHLLVPEFIPPCVKLSSLMNYFPFDSVHFNHMITLSYLKLSEYLSHKLTISFHHVHLHYLWVVKISRTMHDIQFLKIRKCI